MSSNLRHPSRLAEYSEGSTFYPRELTENDGLLYFTNDDGSTVVLNNTGTINIKNAAGTVIGTIDPKEGGDVTIPNASTTVRGLVVFGTVTGAALGTASAGSSDTVARADHVHPLQTTITGNAATATKLATAKTIGFSGIIATATEFDGSANITIPVTAVPASIITGLSDVATSGSYNDLTDKLTTATDTVSGIVKLYTTTGTGTDGSMTRTAITSALDGKAASDHTHTDYAASTHTHAASDITSGTLGVARGGTGATSLTANRVLLSNATSTTGAIAVSTITSTELGYLDGVTSALQTQLDGKAASTHTHSDYSSSTHTHAASDITSGILGVAYGGIGVASLTAARVLVSNATSSTGAITVSAITTTELGYLDGVTSNVQTQLDGKAASDHTHSDYAASTHTHAASDITSGTFGIARGGTGVSTLSTGRVLVSNASSTTGAITVSDVTTTELGYLGGVTSNVQTQLDAKQATITGAATTISSADLTASRALISNASGKVAISDVTSTELGYLDGVTSAIQTQLNAKAASTHTHTDYAASTHTHAASDITSGTLGIARGGTGVTSLTAARVLVSNASSTTGAITVSAVTTTELGYLDGVTSNVQTQLSDKATTETYTASVNTTWSGTSAPYYKTVTVSGVLATDNPIVDVVLSSTYDTAQTELAEFAKIYKITTAANSITIYATEKTESTLSLQVKCVR